jgi:hypothetical protein
MTVKGRPHVSSQAENALIPIEDWMRFDGQGDGAPRSVDRSDPATLDRKPTMLQKWRSMTFVMK